MIALSSSLRLTDGRRRGELRVAAQAPDAIASTGASLTWQPNDALQLRVTYGYAFMDVVPTGSRDLQDDGEHIRLNLRPLRLIRGR